MGASPSTFVGPRALCLALALMGGMEVQGEGATSVPAADLSSIRSACVAVDYIWAVATDAVDRQFLQQQLAAMIERLGYDVSDVCTEADAIVEAAFTPQRQKAYGSSMGHTHSDWIVLNLRFADSRGGVIWERNFKEIVRPSRMPEAVQSLLSTAERRIRKDRSRHVAKSGAK